MNIIQMVDAIKQVLATNAEIKAYCNAQFSKDQKVFLGIDPQNPPKVADYPALILYELNVASRTSSLLRYLARIGIAIANNEIVQDSIYSNVWRLSGFAEAIELKELVEQALIHSKKFLRVTLDSEYIPNSVFPVFTASTNLIIESVVSSRSINENL